MMLLTTFISQVCRSLLTIIAFAIFGIGALILSTIFFSAINLCIKKDSLKNKLSRSFIHYSFKIFLLILRVFFLCKIKAPDLSKLNQGKNYLIIANHPTLIDYVIICALIKNVNCMVKKQLLNNIFLKGVVKGAGYIINTDNNDLLHQCQISFHNGDHILIFPEGTRTTYKQAIKLKRGASNIAIRCEQDVSVIKILCSEHFLSKETKWYLAPKTIPIIELKLKQFIKTEDFIRQEQYNNIHAPSLQARHLTNLFIKLLS